MCGEHSKARRKHNASKGSSPRVRGTRVSHQKHASRLGVIPACAGSTSFQFQPNTRCRDHPRVCGEHLQESAGCSAWLGSSPRVRGTHYLPSNCVYIAGIIPACAGNTQSLLLAWAGSWDHPRVCGEHSSGLVCQGMQAGSSPRVRGTPLAVRGGWVVSGIIPACAGNTYFPIDCHFLLPDHPRVCGEHPFSDGKFKTYTGSSPRVRGTLDCLDVFLGQFGIIPACAGNTVTYDNVIVVRRDHPRVCGEHLMTLGGMASMLGSSPRVRGTPSSPPSCPGA